MMYTSSWRGVYNRCLAMIMRSEVLSHIEPRWNTTETVECTTHKEVNVFVRCYLCCLYVQDSQTVPTDYPITDQI